MKRIIPLILALSFMVVPAGALTYSDWVSELGGKEHITLSQIDMRWDDNILELDMPFRPYDKQVVEQNPPDFSWKYIDGATYNLRIAANSSMTDIVYEKTGLLKNVLNPETTFNAGTYYWQVQYVNGTTTSEWSNTRRFRIESNNIPFVIDSMDTMISKIPGNHPRLYLGNEEVKKEAQNNLTYKNTYLHHYLYGANGYITRRKAGNFPTTYAELKNLVDTGAKEHFSAFTSVTDACLNTASYYYLTGDEEAAQYGIEFMNDVCDWLYDDNGNGGKGDLTSYKGHDQVFREVALIGAVFYDTMYDYLTENNPILKEKIRTMVEERGKYLYNSFFTPGGSSNVYKRPYAGHGDTAFKLFGLVALAMYGDIDDADKWLRDILPLYINTFPSFNMGEDGGNLMGTGYWRYDNYRKMLGQALELLDMVNVYEKPGARNEFEYIMYMYPKGSVGAFGDQSYEKPGYYNLRMLGGMYRQYKDPVIAWLYKETDSMPAKGEPNDMLWYLPDNAVAKAPKGYPNGKLLKETGVAAMHSDIEDQKRISLFFRSSEIGAFNHSHPDQNSFVIQAYGENLAIDSGYYDYYYSDHDRYYTRNTFAHNAITYNGGVGQELRKVNGVPQNDNEYNKSLKGNIEGFITTDYFDSVTGNAKESYKGNLDKAKRSIIYIRPDVFIVVDDLKYKNNENTTFEFYLHGYENVQLIDNNSAKIIKGAAELNADVLYPSVTGDYSDKFERPDGTEYNPSGTFAERQVHQRVWFKTPSVNKTKMVTTLKVNKTGQTPKNVISETFTDYIKITSDDSIVYVNLTDGRVATGDGIIFEGAAVTKDKNNNILLTDGTYLKISDKELITADENVTVYLGEDKTKISADKDTFVSILNKDISSVSSVDGGFIPLNKYKNGVKLTKFSDGIKFKLDRGEYGFSFNEIPVTVGSDEIVITDTKFTENLNTLNYKFMVERTESFKEDTSYYLILGLYDENSLVKTSKTDFDVLTTDYKKEISGDIIVPDASKEYTLKAYVWEEGLAPKITPSIYSDSSVNVKSITIDGNKLPDFNNDNNIYTYTYNYIKEGSPEIKVITENSAAKVEITNINEYPGTAEIKITSQDNTIERIINITFDIGLTTKTEKVYLTNYAEGYGSNAPIYAFQSWQIAPGKEIPGDNKVLQARKKDGGLIPLVKFDLSDKGIDLTRVKEIKLVLYMAEYNAIKEGEKYTTGLEENAVEHVADDTFKPVEIAPNLVYESSWDTMYTSCDTENYPYYTKYAVGESVTVKSTSNKKYEMKLDMNLIRDYMIKNKSLSFAICVQNYPKMVHAQSKKIVYGNTTNISCSMTSSQRPCLQITYYE